MSGLHQPLPSRSWGECDYRRLRSWHPVLTISRPRSQRPSQLLEHPELSSSVWRARRHDLGLGPSLLLRHVRRSFDGRTLLGNAHFWRIVLLVCKARTAEMERSCVLDHRMGQCDRSGCPGLFD